MPEPMMVVPGFATSPITDLSIQTEPVDVTTWDRTEVDRDWLYTDPSGHNHDAGTWRVTTVQPTKEVWCEDCDDLHYESDGPRVCKWCDAVVEPKLQFGGYFSQFIPGVVEIEGRSTAEIPVGTLMVAGSYVMEVVSCAVVAYVNNAPLFYRLVLNQVGIRIHEKTNPFGGEVTNGH